MYQIATMPSRHDGLVTLLAKTEEWQRFILDLRKQRKGAIIALITLDPTQPVNKITLPAEQAFQVLAEAGVAY